MFEGRERPDCALLLFSVCDIVKQFDYLIFILFLEKGIVIALN